MPLTPNSPVALQLQKRRERAGLLVVMAVVLTLLVASRWDSWRDLEHRERTSLQAQARAIEDALLRQLVTTRAALQGTRSNLEGMPRQEGQLFAAMRLVALAEAMPGIRSLHLLDARGLVWASSDPGLVGSSFAASEHFRSIADGRPLRERLYLSQPHLVAADVRSVSLSLALLGEDGAFSGVATATLEPGYLRTLIAATLYASDMTGLIVHGGSGQIVLQHPEPPVGGETGDQLLGPESTLWRHRQSGQQAQVLSGTLPTSAGQPGPPRLLALRSMQPAELQMDAPLLLALSRDLGVVFAPWWVDSAIAAGLLLLGSAAAWLGLRSLQRRRAELEMLALSNATRHAADNERLAMALRGGDLALWDTQLPSRTSVVNDRWYTMLGFSRDDNDASGAQWVARIHPDDRDRVLAAQQAHIDGRTPAYEATYRLHHRQGHWVWVLDRGQVVERDPQGRALRMVGTHMDISERVRAEQAVRDSEAQLIQLTAALPGPVSRLDRDGRCLFCNAASERWFGRSHAQEDGRSWRDMYPAEVLAVVDPQMALALAGQTCTFDVALPTLTGPRDSMVSLVPDRDPGGAVQGCFVVVTDISQRKHAEQALRDSQDQLRMASRLARLGGWRQDFLTGEPTLSEDLQTMLGLPPGRQLAASEGFSFVAAESQESLRTHTSKCRETGLPFDVEIDAFTVPNPKARSLRLRVLGEAVHNAAGRVVAMQGAVQDVTEAYAAAQHLQQLEAERLALERQLREAQKMESIGTLAGGIAHDFNNILPAILGNVALARADLPHLPPTHVALQSLDQINIAALRARSLVQQILTFSRRRPSALQPQPLRPVVEETLALLRATLPATVLLDEQLAEETLVVEADATQLQQVLMNLCTNAWHALPEGHGRIEVGLRALSDGEAATLDLQSLPPGPLVHLWVRDDGSGIDAATLPRIFDPFFTTKAAGRGTGLGLSVVHGIVRAHQGAIKVESEPGAGSTFHVYLPRQALPEAEPAAKVDLPAAAQGHGQQLLYVDDDEVMVQLVQRLLERDGYRVLVSASARDALARVRDAPENFDLVVTDFNMPEMTGLDLARALAEVRPELPVIISSGYLTDHLRSEAKAAGVRALLRKENTLDKLPQLVGKVLAATAVPEGNS